MAELIEDSEPIFVDVAKQSELFPGTVPLMVNESTQLNQDIKAEMADMVHVKGVTSKQNIKPDAVAGTELGRHTQAQPTRIRCTEKKDGVDCRYSTESSERLVQHVRKVHQGLNPFQCCMCDYSTYNKSLFGEHVRIHQGIKPFKCTYCPYRSVSKKNTRRHELVHRSDNPFRCRQCSFIARHQRALTRHMQTHRGGGKCDLCDFKAPSLRTMKEHYQTHGPKKCVTCDKCSTGFSSPRNLAEHLKKMKRCDECDEDFCHKLLLTQHMARVHGARAGAGSFACALCPWASSSAPRILLHLLHHPAQPPPGPPLDLTPLRELGIVA